MKIFRYYQSSINKEIDIIFHLRRPNLSQFIPSFKLISLSVFGLSCAQAIAADSFEPYKGAALIKFEQEKQSEYSIPLANLKKSGRSWVPIRAEIVQGDISSNLFQFARDVDLTRLYDFYKNQLSDASSILYECQGRTCGSSNAWANNFFNDYRLYGADANQSLLVTSLNDNNQYQVVYLNRRGDWSRVSR